MPPLTGPYCASCGQKPPHSDLTAFVVSETILIVMGSVALAYIVANGVVTLRRVFQDSWVRTITKAAILAIAYALCLFAVTLGLLAYALAMM